jgi:iron complex outermembrane receptor protein
VKYLSTYRIFGVVAIGVASSLAAAQDEAESHEEDRLEEIVVTAPFEESEAETVLPIGILSGEALREKVTNSLGETLKNEIGVNNASFGTGVGQPIIRGQTGNRVSVLQNGIGLTDASNVSPDHANGVEPLLADRIEVIRGPSTLLYGSGAVGGVVNVIDNRIPEVLTTGTEFQLEQNYNSVNDEDKTVFRLDSSIGRIGIHIDGFKRDNDNVDIDGFAIDEAEIERLEEHVEEVIGEEHEEEHEEEEFENTNGFVGNSDGEAEGGTAGFSYVGDNGFFGFSVSSLENEYGLPPGTHSHGHDGEDHEDEEEEEVEYVRLNLDQTRYDFKGMLNFQDSWVQSIQATIGLTDYEHKEIETFEDGGSEVGTLFSNEGFESRFILKRQPTGDWSGVYGLQVSDSEFSALGEEAYIPESDINNLGFFGVERYTRDRFTGELGFRWEAAERDPGSSCAYDEKVMSFSASGLYDVNDNSNFLVAAARSERAPSVEELFSNTALDTCDRIADEEMLVLHAATGLLEIGNANLDEEISTNVEFGYRIHSGPVTGEFSAYYNSIDDYIYLDITGEEIEEQTVASYLQQDARFVGLEAELTWTLLESDNMSGELTLFGDLVNASFDSGGDVPRIPAAKFGTELRYFGDNWSAHVHVTRVDSQDDVGRLELETDGYTLVSIYADYHFNVGENSELKVFARGDNLLDEEIRNHASFLKNYSPEAGRGITVGVRYEY